MRMGKALCPFLAVIHDGQSHFVFWKSLGLRPQQKTLATYAGNPLPRTERGQAPLRGLGQLDRRGVPEGSSCHHSDPIRYVVRGASHPVISAKVARPRRDQQEHAEYSPKSVTLCKYTQLCDFVSQLTLGLSCGASWVAEYAESGRDQIGGKRHQCGEPYGKPEDTT
jgi:hypothetical protein